MLYRPLGQSGLQVSALTLGSMMFGEQTSAEDSLRIIDKAWDQGVNFVDTADVYNDSTRCASLLFAGASGSYLIWKRLQPWTSHQRPNCRASRFAIIPRPHEKSGLKAPAARVIVDRCVSCDLGSLCW